MSETKSKQPRVLENEDGSKTVKLIDPIDFGEERFESLTFRKPKAKHLKKIKLNEVGLEDILGLAGKLSGQTPMVMDELSVPDLSAVVGVIEDFLESMERAG